MGAEPGNAAVASGASLRQGRGVAGEDAMELARRFDALTAPPRVPCPVPGAADIAAIEQHFGVAMPALLVDMAILCKAFGARYLSLGADREHAAHIIRINSYWKHRRRTRRLPPNLIIITHGFDEEMWCLDKDTSGEQSAEMAVQFWCPARIDYPTDNLPTLRYPDFRSFVEADLFWQAQRVR